MSLVVMILLFGVVALAAASFVALPLLNRSRSEAGGGRKPLLALLSGLGVIAAGVGAYAYIGQPQIALSSFGTPAPTDYPALVATLARQMPERPSDPDGWTLLGRGYLALGNPDQAAKALERAVAISRARDGFATPQLLSNYGEAMTEAAGQVTQEAEAAFKEAIKEDPKDLVSRYYVGLAMADRGDSAGALSTWEAVLADAPADVPWRGQLVDQMAALRSQQGGGAPNPMAMVAQLASRLESNPNDLEGWLRLIRAYSVLGDKDKANAALVRARTVFADQAQAQSALEQAAKENALN